MMLRITIRRQEYFLPLALVLKALHPTARDLDINAHVMDPEGHRQKMRTDNLDRTKSESDLNRLFCVCWFKTIVVIVCRLKKARALRGREPQAGVLSDSKHPSQHNDSVQSLGNMISNSHYGQECCQTDAAHLGRYLLNNFVAVHVNQYGQKHGVLQLMAQKLYNFVRHGCCEDNVDAFSMQELLLPGQLLTALFREKLEDTMSCVLGQIRRDLHVKSEETMAKVEGGCSAYFTKVLKRFTGTIGDQIVDFVATGNLVSSGGLDLQQTSGLSLIAERLNIWRYRSHFQAVHRGQFFTTMKTTSTRKLLPESWGFLCPVHTPDGSPCGLLSHLSSNVCVTNSRYISTWMLFQRMSDVLVSLGMQFPAIVHSKRPPIPSANACNSIVLICLDGAVLGSADSTTCLQITKFLRTYKRRGLVSVLALLPSTMEVIHLPADTGEMTSFPGVYLFTHQARLLRPVLSYSTGTSCIEYVSPLEQTALHIVCSSSSPKKSDPQWPSSLLYGRRELNAACSLSVLASLTPFSDFNQSPRNMYQCQMAKQSMGTPTHALPHRRDNKLYRLMTPQAPLVHSRTHATAQNENDDQYPQGMNAVVAVVSFTGYDMEDAMILNRSSLERGFAYGAVYKNFVVDIDEAGGTGQAGQRVSGPLCFAGIVDSHIIHRGRASSDRRTSSTRNCLPATGCSVGDDGLPEVGSQIGYGQALWCACDQGGQSVIGRYKDMEDAFVDAVRILGYTFAVRCIIVIHFVFVNRVRKLVVRLQNHLNCVVQ